MRLDRLSACPASCNLNVFELLVPQPAERHSLSFAPIGEIVEQGHAVSLGPNTDFAGLGERVVFPFKSKLAVEGHLELVPLEVHAQSVPLVGGNFHVSPFL